MRSAGARRVCARIGKTPLVRETRRFLHRPAGRLALRGRGGGIAFSPGDRRGARRAARQQRVSGGECCSGKITALDEAREDPLHGLLCGQNAGIDVVSSGLTGGS